jgi:hypothetical protein
MRVLMQPFDSFLKSIELATEQLRRRVKPVQTFQLEQRVDDQQPTHVNFSGKGSVYSQNVSLALQIPHVGRIASHLTFLIRQL